MERRRCNLQSVLTFSAGIPVLYVQLPARADEDKRDFRTGSWIGRALDGLVAIMHGEWSSGTR